MPVLVEADPGGLRAVPLLSVSSYALEDVARFGRTGEGGLVLRLADLTDRLRTTRHDINNPLAAALVEVQLLLMDAPDDETRRACGVIQDQLRLIKQMVAQIEVPGVGRRRQADAVRASDGEGV